MLKRLVSIGINKYTSPVIRNLKVCERDALEVYAIFNKHPFLFHESSKILSTKLGSEYPSKNNILFYISEVCHKCIDDDVMLLFFSGHGNRDGGEQYLLPADSNKEDVNSFIKTTELKQKISVSKASQKIIIIDACYSGESVSGLKAANKSIDPEAIAKSFSDIRGVHMIFSCGKDEVSWEHENGKYSVFTYFLIKALQGEKEALDGSKLTIDSLFSYLSKSVQRHSRMDCSSVMTPVRYSVSTGDFVIGDYKDRKEISGININDVFMPVGTPTYTYINRREVEEEFLYSLNQRGKQIYLYGPSGSGKTCLYETVLNGIDKKYVLVPCKAYYDNPLQLHYAIYSLVVGVLKSINMDVPFPMKVAQLKHELLDKLANELVEKDIVLVLDDFHRLSDEVTIAFADTLKTFISLGVKIIMVGVKNKAAMLIHNYPDLSARIDGIEIYPLSKNKLRQIIHLGEEVLNIKISNKTISETVTEAIGTASLVHELCLGILNEKKIKRSSNQLIYIKNTKVLKAACVKIAKKKKTIYEVIYNSLCLGRRPTKKFATYRYIMEAIASLPKDRYTIHKEELYKIITRNYPLPPPRNVFNSSLNNIENIQSKFKQVISYNSMAETIEIVDRNFKFYLKWLK